MEFDKVLRKQKKSYKRFMLSMGFIFILLPVILYVSKSFKLFFIIYLCILETMIILAVIARYNDEYLKFNIIEGKIIISVLMGRVKYKVNIEKVVGIHTVPQEKYFDIIIITSSTFRNKRIKLITDKVVKRYDGFEAIYNKINFPTNKQYYYFIVKRGGVKKYLLLKTLFKRCVGAVFSSNAIENIKELGI